MISGLFAEVVHREKLNTVLIALLLDESTLRIIALNLVGLKSKNGGSSKHNEEEVR